MDAPVKDTDSVICSEVDSMDNKTKAHGNGCALKVRKPYTITKQRERWSEEEHQRFLEALKLHGRAWRQIEEHVGTKTAIQIRSHAQKFFSKVVRDSNMDAEGSFNLIEIPPPRPKKKPLHPYPRKMDSISSEVVAGCQSTRSPYPVEQGENGSPISVLSTISSDAELLRSCHSPVSCATDARSEKLLRVDNVNNDYAPSLNSKEEEEEEEDCDSEAFVDPVQSDNPVMNSASIAQNTESCPSFKLFGKTFLVSDTRKESTKLEDCFKSSSSPPYSLKLKPDDAIHNHVSFHLPENSLKDFSRHMGNVLGLSWWSWYQSLAYHHISCNAANYVPTEANQISDSNNPSTGKKRKVKGFMPYKRCLADKDDNASISNHQEHESHQARVCS